MSLPEDLKSLYVKWLEEELEKVGAKHEKLAIVYGRALDNLRQHDGPLFLPSSLLAVKGIGNRIKTVMKQKLATYCKELDIQEPQENVSIQNATEAVIRQKIRVGQGDDIHQEETRPKKRRKYVPKRRSGAYAILLALLEGYANRGMTKDEISRMGHKFCDHSFNPNVSTRQFHGAWSAIKTLLERELVLEKGRPKRYYLTDDGDALAELLKKSDDILFENEEEYQKHRESSDIAETRPKSAFEDFETSANLSDLVAATANGILASDEAKKIQSMDFDDVEPAADQGLDIFERQSSISSKGGKTSSIRKENGIIRARWQATNYEVWDAGSFDVVLIIDHREVKSQRERDFFASELMEKGVTTEIRQLAVSDMLWVARHKRTKRECVLNFMLERKRLDDFAMSIIDNRFAEQKNRLKKTGCKNIYYLVEETSASDSVRMEEAIRTAVWVTVIYHGFHVKRTKNSDATVAWLHDMTNVVKEWYSSSKLLVISPQDMKNQLDYERSLRSFRGQFERGLQLECCHRFDCFQEIMGKTSLMTVKELYLRALMLNKGVSLEKALSIQAEYPTMKALLSAYRSCPTEEAGKNLIFESLRNQPGNRKLGKALSETLWKAFGVRRGEPPHE
ncbi:LAMI_0E14532g1_1 [Lachancea mirantina]|uniref:Crossover junction endonuclease MUS81 n=1 Tax=Lachancea mirantina TaxID=1230905 RepID=A0A1G4JRQ4_9SACH|nr:LAMI_0E14532g1_1 [Lachancea mirantina]